MSWDAGAITGGINFDVGHYISQVDRSVGAAEHLEDSFHSADRGAHEMEGGLGDLFSEMFKFQLLAETAIELPLELIKKGFELAEETVKSFFETISEEGDAAQALGLDALKAGVPVEFFSEMTEAAKRVGVSQDELGMSFKFLQKNAVDAVSGMSQEAKAGFDAIGVSTEFLESHLNDTKGLFLAVRDGLSQIPDASERVRVSMQIMGRGGSDILPMFVQTNQQMAESIDLARRLGAVEDESATQSAEGWDKASAAWSDMWTGISRAAAEPVLQYLTNHWHDVRIAIIDTADAIVETMPAALRVIELAATPVIGLFKEMLTEFAGLAAMADHFGLSNNAADPMMKLVTDLTSLQSTLPEIVQNADRFRDEWRNNAANSGGQNARGDTYNITVQATYDPDAPQKIANSITPALRAAQERAAKKTADALNRRAAHDHVSRRVAGHSVTIMGADQ